MKIEQIVLLGLTFVIVFGTALKMLTLLQPDPLKRRLDQLGAGPATPGAAPDENAWIERVAEVSKHVAKLSLPKEDWDRSALRVRFMNAGLRTSSAPAIYFAAKTVLAIALPLIVLLTAASRFDANQRLLLLLVLLFASALGFYLPNFVLTRMVKQRQRALFEALPDALDLTTVCVEAGLAIDAAMMRVTEEIGVRSPDLRDELELMLLELRAGASREKALRNLALRTGVEDIDTLVAMMVQADRFGTSIGDSLRVFTDNLRTKRRLRAEELAAKIALKLLFPLIFCIFPTLMVVLLGPAMINIFRLLLPSMGGHTL
ncbi:type II secretion system F family protein [Trinickia terrae]|uniref:Type II secretion system F family protein n=1 Tax=Trinickia terrae TaxID=2571161 RepID=A0A4U1IG96_9BURK|nr:type II secretion system F family protein [Trinickia terrae]TKC92595.1 type II secretion system F family protein [Trinickia terrae]